MSCTGLKPNQFDLANYIARRKCFVFISDTKEVKIMRPYVVFQASKRNTINRPGF